MITERNERHQVIASAQPLIDIAEAAHLLHISVRYVRLLLLRGQLPVVCLGRRTLVRLTDIEAVVARGGLTNGE